MHQITTLTFFRYTAVHSQVWAFSMMQFAHRHLKKVSGCEFYRLMGSGKGLGFTPFPDWSVYCLLQVWENEQAADNFFRESHLVKRYDKMTSERWTIYLYNIAAKGRWSGGQPFRASEVADPAISKVAVITRATLRPSRLIRFWQYVPVSEQPLKNAPGLIYTKGIGEVPVTHMATFSIWENVEALNDFAYKSKEHMGAIARTRSLNWYREELFSRFQPFRSVGSWQGVQLLPELTHG